MNFKLQMIRYVLQQYSIESGKLEVQPSRLFWLSTLDLSNLIQMSPKPFRADPSRATWDPWQALIGTWPGSRQFPDDVARARVKEAPPRVASK